MIPKDNGTYINSLKVANRLTKNALKKIYFDEILRSHHKIFNPNFHVLSSKQSNLSSKEPKINIQFVRPICLNLDQKFIFLHSVCVT